MMLLGRVVILLLFFVPGEALFAVEKKRATGVEELQSKGIFPQGPRGHRGVRGQKGKKGKRGKKGDQGRRGSSGIQGSPGASGAPLETVEGTISFVFNPIARAETGFWRVIIIAPDGTQTLGPLINIAVGTPDPFQVIVSPTVIMGVYTIVIYNVDITTTLSSPPIQGEILVTFRGVNGRYTSFIAPTDPGFNQQMHYTPFVPPA